MLSDEQIYNNKQRFLTMLDKLADARKSYNDDWAGLRDYLEQSDFFIAPASTLFHANYDGGLCEHCLNVYNTLLQMNKMAYPNDDAPWDWTSLAIVGLFHDISKVGAYNRINKNKKVYCADGSKHDSGGKYDWITVTEWGTTPLKDSFTYGSHEESSVFILQNYINLTVNEITAILYHSGFQCDDFKKSKEVSYVYSAKKLPCLLHLADTYSAFVLEDSGLLHE